MIEHCAETGAPLLPTHFAGRHAGHVTRKGAAFVVKMLERTHS
jgi:hypothetical protein